MDPMGCGPLGGSVITVTEYTRSAHGRVINVDA